MKDFTFPKLHDRGGDLNKRWYVLYYFRHPETDKNTPFYTYISSRLKTQAARRRKASDIVNDLSIRLIEGWSPFEGENPGSTNIIKAIDLTIQKKKSFCRKRTYQSYKSYAKKLKEWLYMEGLSNMQISRFKKNQAQRYIDFRVSNSRICNRTANNTILHCAILFKELVNREYIISNPFSGLPRFPETQNTVKAWSDDDLDKLNEYLPTFSPELFLVAQFIWYCAIRPQELVRLKFENFKFEKGQIYIYGNQSKTKRFNIISMPKPLIDVLINMEYQEMPSDWFVFSTNLLPGKKEISPVRISEQFRGFKLKYVIKRNLYELKHTADGKSLEMGADIRDIQLHNRHSNPSTTMDYIRAFKTQTSKKFLDNYPKL